MAKSAESGQVKVSVLLRREDAERFSVFCEVEAHKKSTLIAKLVHDFLERQDTGGGERLGTPEPGAPSSRASSGFVR